MVSLNYLFSIFFQTSFEVPVWWQLTSHDIDPQSWSHELSTSDIGGSDDRHQERLMGAAL